MILCLRFLFADDTLIFCAVNLDHHHSFIFKAFLGLKVNLFKSELVYMGNVSNVGSWLVYKGGCNVSCLSI